MLETLTRGFRNARDRFRGVTKLTEEYIPQLPKDEGRVRVYGCLALLLTGLYLVAGPKLALSAWNVTSDGNTALEEALAWKRGTLSLSRDYYEDAEVDGKHYNAVGLAFVIMSVIGTTLTEWAGGPPNTFASSLYVLMVAIPLPFVAYWAFRSVVRSSVWAAILSFYLIAGTSLLPVLAMCKNGPIYKINHALAVMGLLVFTADLLGRRRMWPAALGLALAIWSRQLTCLYALPLLWVAWRDSKAPSASAGDQSSQAPSAAKQQPRRKLFVALLGLIIIAGVQRGISVLEGVIQGRVGRPFIHR